MSSSIYLRCTETKKAVHVAERSSRWYRGADYPDAVGAFCDAHQGRQLDSLDTDHFDDFIDYDVWTPENMRAEYLALTGYALPTPHSKASEYPPP